MSIPLIANPTLSDAATITASSQVASLPATNLQVIQPTKIWRSTGTTENIVTDLGSALGIKLVSLLFTNFTSDGTWRIRAATSEANLTASPGYDSGTLTLWPKSGLDDDGFTRFHGFHVPASLQTYRWWRIDLSDPGNADGYVEAGRLYLSNPWEPSRGKYFGWTPPVPVPRSDFSQSVGGQTYVNERPMRTRCDFSLRITSESDVFDNAQVIDRIRRDSRDVLILLDPDNTDRLMDFSIYGVMEGLSGPWSPTYLIWEKRYRITSLD